MKNKKLKTLIAAAVTTSVIASITLNPVIAAASTEEISSSTQETFTYGVGSRVYEELLQKGWTKKSDTLLTVNDNMFKFRNLNGVNGKDASIVITCAEREYDYYILELLDLIMGEGSSLTSRELALKIGNGSSTIKDGSRYINIHYDGDVDYTITVTFYNYGYTPSYIFPSLDNYAMVSTLENLINENLLSVTNFWGATEKHPLELKVEALNEEDNKKLFNEIGQLEGHMNSAEFIEGEGSSTLKVKFNKENWLYDGVYYKYIVCDFTIDNDNIFAVQYAKELSNKLNNVDTDGNTGDGSANTPDSGDNNPGSEGEVVPPVVDGEEDNNHGSTGDGSVSTPEGGDDNLGNEDDIAPPVVDGEEDNNHGSTGDDSVSTPEVGDDNLGNEDDIVPPVVDEEEDNNDENLITIPEMGEITTTINTAVSEGIISIKNINNDVNSSMEIEINRVENSKVQALFNSFSTMARDVKVVDKGEYTTITFKVQKTYNSLLRQVPEYVDVTLNIKNEYEDIVAIAKDFAIKMSSNNESTETEPSKDEDITHNNMDNNTIDPSNGVAKEEATVDVIESSTLPQTGSPLDLSLVGTLFLSFGAILRKNKK